MTMTLCDRYVAAVRADVPAWSFRRAGMLREIRDGLDDAAAAHVDGGLTRSDAERAAVVEFGPADQVAASIRAELAIDTGRIAALAAGVFSGAQMVIAQIVWSGNGSATDSVPTWYGVLARTVDVMALVALVAGVAVAGLLGRSPRILAFARGFDRVAVARKAAIAVLVAVALQAVAGFTLTVFGPGFDALVSSSPLENLHSPGLPIIETILAVQCLRLASGRGRTTGQDRAHDTAERLPLPTS